MKLLAWCLTFALLAFAASNIYSERQESQHRKAIELEIRALARAVQALSDRLATVSEPKEAASMTQTLNWRSGGVAKSHTVTKDENGPETFDEFFDRARAEFDAKLVEFPPDSND